MATLSPDALRVLTTGDGSPTLQRVDTGWTYRSDRGALRESRHVFVEGSGALEYAPLRVLELGFGVGTNFAALLRAARETVARPIEVHAVERAAVPTALLPEFDAHAHALATRATTHGHARDGEISLTLHEGEFAAFEPPGVFDVVWLDPFGPDAEPHSWGPEVAKVVATALAEHGRAVTYSAAGWIRRNLAAAGLFVATVPGPIEGKREFTIAAHDRTRLSGARIRNVPR